MDKKTILIALKDDEETALFTKSLSGLNHDLLNVKDGGRALELALVNLPSLFITEIDLPVISGERLFRILRTNPQTSRIPFLFISSSVKDVKGFRTGIDIFLLRPINQEELVARVRHTLLSKGQASLSKGIEGRLAHISLADIVQFLHMNRKEGELRITFGEHTGVILIKDGEIYNAVTNGVEKEKAFFRLLQWEDGRFEFIPRQVVSARKIRSSSGNLLMEGMRQIDELARDADRFPSPETCLEARTDPSALPKGLQPVIYEVMQVIGRYPLVADIIDRTTYPDYEVYKTLSSLLARGAVQVKKGGPAAPAEEFLTAAQAINIREKILNRFSDQHSVGYARVLIVSTSGRLTSFFFDMCAALPGFSMNQRSAIAQVSADNPLGETATLRLHGGMDLVFFSIPAVRNMDPLWRAFSANLVGVIMLWDNASAGALGELASVRKELSETTDVPMVHVCVSGPMSEERQNAARKSVGMRSDEPIFLIRPEETGTLQEIFYALFTGIIADRHSA